MLPTPTPRPAWAGTVAKAAAIIKGIPAATKRRWVTAVPSLVTPGWPPRTVLALSAILDVNRLSFGKQGPNFAQVCRAREGKAGRTCRKLKRPVVTVDNPPV